MFESNIKIMACQFFRLEHFNLSVKSLDTTTIDV